MVQTTFSLEMAKDSYKVVLKGAIGTNGLYHFSDLKLAKILDSVASDNCSSSSLSAITSNSANLVNSSVNTNTQCLSTILDNVDSECIPSKSLYSLSLRTPTSRVS
ncbi:uncharacterized protein LOC133290333 [Gastrolobium bilobum]|uniref:uncharacterized protein LOC133290333 n=1 Tax=Gastrolobium bilobum TaxID=150636 RepID=UPI002AB0E389|nr:uncharacterized protein LOC133290333 [Gastrolobium bilobum]